MNKSIITIILILIFHMSGYGQSEGDEIKPLFVLLIRNPSLWIFGSDVPTFALYDNRQVIYRKIDAKNSFDFRTTYLDSVSFSTILTSIKQLKIHELKDRYFDSTTFVSHTPNNIMYSFLGKYRLSVSVEARLRSKYEEKYYRELYSSETYTFTDYFDLSFVPDKFITLFEKLVLFENKNETPWTPDKFEVIVSPLKGRHKICWPEHWPDISHPETIPRGEMYSIYLPSAELQLYLDLKNKYEISVFVINGKKYSAQLRYPFPYERYWMN